jgi:RNA polymerase sigma factor (sigma-70 family)
MSPERRGESVGAPESTVQLLARARAGDQAALDEVFARAIPLLKRWASGRLPRWAREMIDTDDLVQETVVNTLKHIDVFEYRVDSALQAYLRQAVMNRIRNEIRRATRHPAPSPLDELIGKQTVEAYDEAMATLEPEERDAIVGRVELGLSYAELAAAMGRPSADAARMAVGRALLKLTKRLKVS